MKLIEDFNEIPTLGFITSTQFAIRTWNLSTVLKSIQDCLHRYPSHLHSRWKSIENEVKSIAGSIVGILPPTLKKDLDAIITPIGRHIKAVREFLHFSPGIETRRYFAYLQVNHWTPYSTVGTESFERILANDRRLANGFRFSLACNDCFEDIIDEVFEFVKDIAIQYKDHTACRELQCYWIFRKTGDVHSFVNVVQSPSHSIDRSNYTAEELVFMYSIKKKNSGNRIFSELLTPSQSRIYHRSALFFTTSNRPLSLILVSDISFDKNSTQFSISVQFTCDENFWSICPEERKTSVKNECNAYLTPERELVLSAIRDVEATAT
ncbi:hypothetical protein TNCV_2335481 [Trichonephila clavipes]|uniref:Uncharacterized protein n=1 Tax=Trichonephila clavipes TaxID=2585209 RepID=A0A8X6VML7_TRICX|nr:hypothetical protein TNCV_2335481 [Trichonephila clavipes]